MDSLHLNLLSHYSILWLFWLEIIVICFIRLLNFWSYPYYYELYLLKLNKCYFEGVKIMMSTFVFLSLQKELFYMTKNNINIILKDYICYIYQIALVLIISDWLELTRLLCIILYILINSGLWEIADIYIDIIIGKVISYLLLKTRLWLLLNSI